MVAMPPVPSSDSIWYSSLICFSISRELREGTKFFKYFEMTKSSNDLPPLRTVSSMALPDLENFKHHRGDIVHTALFVRATDEALCGRRWSTFREDRADLAVIDHFRQPVGTEEDRIVLFYRDRSVVDGYFPIDADGPRDDMSIGAYLRLFGGQFAGADLFRHERVVVRDLVALSLPQKVGAAVADMGDESGPVAEENGRYRCSHACQGRVDRRGLKDLLVRLGDSIAEGGDPRFNIEGEAERRGGVLSLEETGQYFSERIHRHAAGHFAPLVASDAVRDGIEPQAVVLEKGILVVFSLFTRVRSAGGEYFHHGLVLAAFYSMTYTDSPGLSVSTNSMMVLPSWNVSPCARPVSLIDLPSRKVPFLLPRSLRTNRASENSMAACMRETAGSSTMISEPVPLPMTVRLVEIVYSAPFLGPFLIRRDAAILPGSSEAGRSASSCMVFSCSPGISSPWVVSLFLSEPMRAPLYFISNTLPPLLSSRMNWIVVSPTWNLSRFSRRACRTIFPLNMTPFVLSRSLIRNPLSSNRMAAC